VLAVFATSRIFYLVSGFLLAKFVPTSSHQLTTTDVPPGSLSIWCCLSFSCLSPSTSYTRLLVRDGVRERRRAPS
jgi:hypothetical protein